VAGTAERIFGVNVSNSGQKSRTSLVLTKYGNQGASSRIRLLQFVPALSESVEVRVQRLLGDHYVRALNHGNRFRQVGFGLYGVLDRLILLCSYVARRKTFDVVIVQQELVPYAPTKLETWLLRRLAKDSLIIDIDDAEFLRYRNRHGLIRVFCDDKLTALWRTADSVVCGSAQLRRDVVEATDGQTVCLDAPSVVERDAPARRVSRRSVVRGRIGWIGSPSTARDLQLIREPLQAVATRHSVEFWVVGGRVDLIPGVSTSCLDWSRENEELLLETMDIGVMPLTDSVFRRRKCGFKVVQYMTAGIPVVASDVGGNRDIVIHGELAAGYMARDSAEWEQAFDVLLSDERTRERMAETSMLLANRHYSHQMVADLWRALVTAEPSRNGFP
jgi:glycosyltransferase involved in cell wall biosynthesis